MSIVAVFNVKGGVGKTSLAVNLAYASATASARRTLLWDIDPQGGCRLLLGLPTPARPRARSVFDRSVAFERVLIATGISGLDLLPGDPTLQMLDHYLLALGKKKRVSKLAADMTKHYDRIVIDCAPALNEVTDQIVRAADLLVIPIQPSPLARAALEEVRGYLLRYHKGHAPILPVFSMFDARRRLHKLAAEEESNWPIVPMSSLMEQMGSRGRPIGAYAARSAGAQSIGALWQMVEQRLQKTG